MATENDTKSETATAPETTTAPETLKKMLILRSSDGKEFEVEESVVTSSQTIKNMIEDDCTQDAVPLANVTAIILAKVIEYSKKHADSSPIGGFEDRDAEEELKKWDAEFVNVDQDTLFDLILAANYLNNKGLLDLTCKTVADMMKGKTPEQIRDIFHIKNDYTQEEEEEVRRENAWAFE